MSAGPKTSIAPSAVAQTPRSPTTRVLFGPLSATDVSAAVVRRLRAAIGLGLLADGDRLPREADLAGQLGITTFSLREALGELRQQGLLVTRAGKYGGSFVIHPPESEVLEHDELLRLSSAELRDLGDWRLMLAAHSAALAAHRASESNCETLTTYAHRVGAADTSQSARRAHGRFHVELASAAQSMRMTRAEFGVHEEIDWLFALALQTPAQREASARGLLEIVAAVQAHDAAAARAAAERYSSRLVGELARLRLGIIAARQEDVGLTSDHTIESEAVAFSELLLDQLSDLAQEVAPMLAAGSNAQELKSQVSLAILKRIGNLPQSADEVAVLAEVGTVPGHRYWTVAWTRTESGPVEDNSHVMDPSREDFYDYEAREFMAQPRKRLQAWATGPYVDYGGADDYILTLSVPIVSEGRFLGVTIVDFLAANLERLLAPRLAESEGQCLLLNWENRVIVSNSVEYSAGDVMGDLAGFERTELPVFGWSVLRAPAETSA